MASGANVFISYASDTKGLAEELTRALEKQGIEPWVDFKDLRPGQRPKDELERAVAEAQWFLILVGADSRTSRWQEAEWSAALARTWTDQQKRLLPIVFGQNDPPPFLRNFVPLRVNPDTESATWTRKVTDAMRGFGGGASEATLNQIREAWQERLGEIQQAADVLRQEQADVAPGKHNPSK